MFIIKKIMGYCDGCKKFFMLTHTVNMTHKSGLKEKLSCCDDCADFYEDMQSHWK